MAALKLRVIIWPLARYFTALCNEYDTH